MKKKKYCPKCEQDKKLDEFSNNKNNIDGKQRTCRKCMAEDQKKSYLKNKKDYLDREKIYQKKKYEKINKLKQESGCIKCGDKRYYVLNFHHLDPNIKNFSISDAVKRISKERLKEEIDKCIILCSNCHDEFHYLERKEGINIKKFLKLVPLNKEKL